MKVRQVAHKFGRCIPNFGTNIQVKFGKFMQVRQIQGKLQKVRQKFGRFMNWADSSNVRAGFNFKFGRFN